MGASIKYIRRFILYLTLYRKREAGCMNPEEYDSVADITSCKCTEEDYECIYGFERDEGTNKCVPMAERF